MRVGLLVSIDHRLTEHRRSETLALILTADTKHWYHSSHSRLLTHPSPHHHSTSSTAVLMRFVHWIRAWMGQYQPQPLYQM